MAPPVGFASDLTCSRSQLLIENAFLRQQLLILKRQGKRPRLSWRERALLVVVASLLPSWKQSFLIVQPETLLRCPKHHSALHARTASTTCPFTILSVSDEVFPAPQVIEDWRQEYNHCRPHNSLGYRAPAAFAEQARSRITWSSSREQVTSHIGNIQPETNIATQIRGINIRNVLPSAGSLSTSMLP